MKTIPLTRGKVALVDDDDFEEVSRFKWHALKAKNGRWYGARRERPSGRYLYMHRVITGAPRGFDVDHRNHDGLDNRRKNMRVCTRSQNLANKRPRAGNSSRFKGVTWHAQCKKWLAQLEKDGRCRSLGLYGTEEEAAAAYLAGAKKFHGEFALGGQAEGAR